MADKRPVHCYELGEGPLRLAGRAIDKRLATAVDLCETRRQWAEAELQRERSECLIAFHAVFKFIAADAKADEPPRGARLQVGADAAWIGYDDPPEAKPA